MYALFVKVNLKPECVDAYLEAVIAFDAKGSIGNEPGCLRFDVLRDEADPSKVYLYEVYADKAAFEAHGKTPHIAKFRERFRGWRRDQVRSSKPSASFQTRTGASSHSRVDGLRVSPNRWRFGTL